VYMNVRDEHRTYLRSLSYCHARPTSGVTCATCLAKKGPTEG
jgi:hypothetical protein